MEGMMRSTFWMAAVLCASVAVADDAAKTAAGDGDGVLENIATGGGLDNAFAMWQNSGAHYASIVSGTTDAGFGYAVGPNGATYFVGIYGSGSPGNGETEEQIAKYLEEEKEAAAK